MLVLRAITNCQKYTPTALNSIYKQLQELLQTFIHLFVDTGYQIYLLIHC